MNRFGIALDLGTSGFRAQAVDLDSHKILATAITARHPLPGANVMDHLHFALEAGTAKAHDVVIQAVNRLIWELAVPSGQIVRLAVCGNPIQVSLFQEIEIRDLAYAGERKREALGIVAPERNAAIVSACDIRGLLLPKKAEVLIPPAVRHEIGADALAMMIKTGIVDKNETAIVTDYGTNAEMALMVNGTVYTGSTAAGPALEGQQITNGMLALPGAICDVTIADKRLNTRVLGEDMLPYSGAAVHGETGNMLAPGELPAKGITGTGVISLIAEALRCGMIRLPKIHCPDRTIHLPEDLKFTEKDLTEAGKAIGAIRAGHISLCKAAGIGIEEITVAYMAGASGTYVDALKARDIGLVPGGVRKIYQVGNTSLAMACDMVKDPEQLWRLKALSEKLRQHHCMFATSGAFEKAFILELSYWTEGMSMDQFQKYLSKFNLPHLPQPEAQPEVHRTATQDIADLGERGLTVIDVIEEKEAELFSGCTACEACVAECPESALKMKEADGRLSLDLSRCNGFACLRCEGICPEKVFDYRKMIEIA
ncbi:MAG: methylamine methyltransferase corrinoid protein reductive activase [Deltaproteobacteria bacterium]|nr:methylamine methyltransferase corrinoid protein reductive activase [Deltaproteobacteria bacterium]